MQLSLERQSLDQIHSPSRPVDRDLNQIRDTLRIFDRIHPLEKVCKLLCILLFFARSYTSEYLLVSFSDIVRRPLFVNRRILTWKPMYEHHPSHPSPHCDMRVRSFPSESTLRLIREKLDKELVGSVVGVPWVIIGCFVKNVVPLRDP